MAQLIRSAFWVSFGVYLLASAYLRHLHPSTDPFASKGIENVLMAAMGTLLIYGAYDTYRRRNLPERTNPDTISPRSAIWMWLVGAALLVFSMFWPLIWRFSLDLRLLGRILMLAYFLFEAREVYLRKDKPPAVRDQNSNLATTGGSIGVKIMAAIVIAFGVAVISVGLWYATSEWSKITEWPRTTGVLIDKKISAMGARLIFEYDVTGGRSAGRVERWGSEEEMRGFLEPYRPGNVYQIGYNPQDASEVEFDLGYNWDLFRTPIAIVIFGALFVAAGLVLGNPWRRDPRR
jgi:uncharacterized protein DUF3592